MNLSKNVSYEKQFVLFSDPKDCLSVEVADDLVLPALSRQEEEEQSKMLKKKPNTITNTYYFYQGNFQTLIRCTSF